MAGDDAQMIMFSKAICTWSAPYVIDGSRPKRTTWRFVHGTGKFTGIKGSGTFKDGPSANGWWADLAGNYSLPKAKAKAKKIR